MYNQKNVCDLNGEQLLILQKLREVKGEIDELFAYGERSGYIRLDEELVNEARKSLEMGLMLYQRVVHEAQQRDGLKFLKGSHLTEE